MLWSLRSFSKDNLFFLLPHELPMEGKMIDVTQGEEFGRVRLKWTRTPGWVTITCPLAEDA